MFISVLVRRLRPGKPYGEFVDAWYPDKGFGFPGGIYEIAEEFDFSTDETVSRGRPRPGS